MTDYRAALESAALFDLSARAKIELRGRDAREFLHNLCTQDVKDLAVGETREAFLTTSKARVVAHVWITHRESDLLWLDAGAGQAEKILQHLNRFLISEQVEVTDRTSEFGLLRVVGPKAQDIVGDAPARRHRLLGIDGFDLSCPKREIASRIQALIDAGAVHAGASSYAALRIEAGVPEYGSDIDENRLAMEVNRTAQAISYTKGCYLGQETIVMARDRGQVNRLLMGVKVATGNPLAVGTRLIRTDEEVGQVTSSVLSPRLNQVIALAYLRRGAWDPGTELVIDPSTDGRAAVVAALPFC